MARTLGNQHALLEVLRRCGVAAVIGLLLYVELQRRNVILHITLLELWDCIEGVIHLGRLFHLRVGLLVLGLEVV